MSPRKTTASRQQEADATLWRSGLMVASMSLLLLLAPIIYRLTTRLIEEDYDSKINTNLLAFSVTFIFGTTFMLISNSYIKHFSRQIIQEYQQQLQSFHHQREPTFLYKFFPLFAKNSQSSSTNNRANDKSSTSSADQNYLEQDSQSRRRIDPKYFKPKFIIHELITFWDTTCTVITWGSFYVIGGTIVATEKITQRIKSKRESSSTFFGENNNRNSSRGTGQSDSSFASAFGSASQSDNNAATEPQSNRQPFKRISSWTKRSINSIKKKYSRAVRSNAPQLTSGPANESSSSIFFFVPTTNMTAS
jgi:hypothetical protein